MKNLTLFSLSLILLVSCNQTVDTIQPAVRDSSWILVADDIQYDVILKPTNEFDEWEIERLKGFNGDEMVNSIFNSILSGELEAYEYHSGEKLSAKDIKKIEEEPGFVRENLGKLQFTETWYFNPATLQIEKVVKSIVLGYELPFEEGMPPRYQAAFRIEISD
jgi:hypothetical protein